jgi:hypothetical protein
MTAATMLDRLRALTAFEVDFAARPSVDPRGSYWPPSRSVAVLLFVAEGGEVMQPQVHERYFHGRSEAVVSRAIRNLADHDLLSIDRWNNVGVNRLRLTTYGRDLLLAVGVPEHAIFTLRKPVAPAHVGHTTWINDLRVVVARSGRTPAFALPAWALQRLVRPLPPTIPDLLVHFGGDGKPPLTLAFEVDLGSERLRKVFVPKLRLLQEVMGIWSGDARAIIVLTSGLRRAALLRAHLSATEAAADLIVDTLPSTTGRQAIAELRDRLSFLG